MRHVSHILMKERHLVGAPEITETLGQARAGGQVLSLLARPLNCLTVQALGSRPMRLGELLKELGGPSQTTLRGRLTDLVALGAVAKRGGGMPYAVENELTDAGHDLLHVVDAIEAWLSQTPEGPIPLGSVAAKGAIKALAGGWESTMLRAFAARPLSLTQLDRLIGSLSYPALERRLGALRTTGLVKAAPAGARTPYRISRWGREGMGPLAAAARFERLHMSDLANPLAPIDVETAFLLATPIAELHPRVDGTCQLAAQIDGRQQRLAGVNVAVDRGKVVECVAQLEPKPQTWALGDTHAWLDAMVRCDYDALHISGNEKLVSALVEALHRALYQPNGNS
jgi:DNA-binding HxlR family transcriptional regulator